MEKEPTDIDINVSLFSFHKSDGYLWFRIFGIGLGFKDIKKHEFLFSERYGYVKNMMIKGWVIRFLH